MMKTIPEGSMCTKSDIYFFIRGLKMTSELFVKLSL